ncbi:hypothetical protein PHJA_000368500 [Phtheirospermum japonicum]|uniref:Uncharacterized protein n=1 Tax=Phtheirospermum japonicum TaxID=374723 RepID=A0A830BD15_9LAMI|nr:hypothetical protein PHJA_000368500 [Phtheirospermum japonicum]
MLVSVREFNQQTNFGGVNKEKPKKFDHLVLGPAAGEGLHDRLQCQGNPKLIAGTKALSKMNFGTFLNKSHSTDHVAVVTVFTTYKSTAESSPIDLVTVGNISYDKVDRSMAVLNVFVNFIQVTMPLSNVIILTDPASELQLRRDMVTVQPIQGEYSRDKLMLQRIRSYIAFLETRLEKLSQNREPFTHFIFTDSDIAVIDDLGRIFTDYPNFDLALTFRNNKEQPLNSGFIAVRGTTEGIKRGKAFLQEVLEVYSSKFMKASRMLGDQLALAWIVVHFKGSRKRLMLESWNFYSSSSNLPNMLCLILKSGRTKYDF